VQSSGHFNKKESRNNDFSVCRVGAFSSSLWIPDCWLDFYVKAKETGGSGFPGAEETSLIRLSFVSECFQSQEIVCSYTPYMSGIDAKSPSPILVSCRHGFS
jgi:hypothetical protein